MIGRAVKDVIVQLRATGRYAQRRWNAQSHPPVGREPAFDPETRAWFCDRIRRCQAYLEYGAGASTLLAADAGIPSISIESDARYAEAVRAALAGGELNKVVAIDIGVTEDWGYPVWTFPTPGALRKWRRYPMAGPGSLEALGRFPDLVLIDGRFRVACCLAIARVAAERGEKTEILFDDYALRPQYRVIEKVLGIPDVIGRARIFRIDGQSMRASILDEAFAAATRDFT